MKFLLKPLNLNDWDLFESLYCDNNVMQHLGNAVGCNEAEKIFNIFIEGQKKKPPKYLLYKIIDLKMKNVGIVGGFFVAGQKSTIELGSMILKHQQKLGFSTGAIRQFGELVKNQYGVKFIRTKSDVNNTGAILLMKKLNFKIVRVIGNNEEYNWLIKL